MTLTPIEKEIRHQLGVPDDAPAVLVFAQSAHLDWDWLNQFPYLVDLSGTPCDPTYFGPGTGPSDRILGQAYNLIDTYSDYWWSICEIGFLQRFADDQPAWYQQAAASGRLAVVGGGITSPDNLTPDGEAFLRDFLVAYEWFSRNGLKWTRQVWLPDDFGHDSQLPVMLQALGADGVGFARVPGACDQGNVVGDTAKTLLGAVSGDPGGVDFYWRAADGSRVFAHWLPDHYGQGQNIQQVGQAQYTDDSDLAACNGVQSYPRTPVEHIGGYVSLNRPVSPTPYVLVDVGGDFSLPIGGTDPGTRPADDQQLAYYAKQWNQGNGPNSYAATGVWVAVGTFDHYSRLVQAYAGAHPGTLLDRDFHAASGARPFVSNPYWMGYYASRPELKILHDRATAALLAAESWNELYLFAGGSYDAATIERGWNQLAPSTHHDYVTGTALTCVYTGEQLPLLQQALASGESARDAALLGLAGKVAAAQPTAVTFNALGFERRGLALLPTAYELAPPPSGAAALQASADGGWLLWGEAPGHGFASSPLSQPPPSGPLSISADGAGNVTLANGYLSATVSAADATLSSLRDLGTGTQVFSGAANALAFFSDPAGDVYRFGFEMPNSFTRLPVTAACSGLRIVERGPIRVRVEGDVEVTASAFTSTYTLVYSLVQGDPFVRVSVHGAAPTRTAVMVSFPFAAAPDELLHGTPYHWDVKTVASFPSGAGGFHPTFEAVHDFVAPLVGGVAAAAVYPASCRAWTVDGQALYGCILRNSQTVTWTSENSPSDPDPHTIEYAVRVPGGLPAVAGGGLLREARGYAVPLVAASLGAQPGSLPATQSLVRVVTPASVVVTAAKRGSFDESALVVRLYQPTNAPLAATLDLSTLVGVQPGWIWQAAPATALERPLAGVQPVKVGPDGRVTVTLERALTTLVVSRIG